MEPKGPQSPWVKSITVKPESAPGMVTSRKRMGESGNRRRGETEIFSYSPFPPFFLNYPQLPQHCLGVLAFQPARTDRPRRRLLEPPRQAIDTEGAPVWSIQVYNMLVLDDLRMMAQRLEVHDAAVWHPLLGEPNNPPGRRLCAEAFFQKGDQFRSVLDSLRIRRETRIIIQFFQPERPAETRPPVLAHHAHSNVFLILAEERLVRHGGRHSTPHRLRLL